MRTRVVPRGKRRLNPRLAPKHLAFVRLLPCIACGAAAPSEAAHVRIGTDGGSGLRPSDRYALPLCTSRPGREGCHARQHRIGERTFWAKARINPLAAADALWVISTSARWLAR